MAGSAERKEEETVPLFETLSILGLYNFSDKIFDELQLPDGVDRDLVIPSILAECSDFCLLYPNWDFMQSMIGVWSRAELHIWDAMQKSISFEYDPLENYDRKEEIQRESSGKSSDTVTGSSTSNTTGHTEATGARTSFNSNNFQPAAKDETDSTGSSTGTTLNTSLGTASGSEKVTARVHGNIGVMTYQTMIEGYRGVSNFNVVDFIVNSFKNRFCVQVY